MRCDFQGSKDVEQNSDSQCSSKIPKKEIGKIYTVYNVYILNKCKNTLCILHPTKKKKTLPLPPPSPEVRSYKDLCARFWGPQGLAGWGRDGNGMAASLVNR